MRVALWGDVPSLSPSTSSERLFWEHTAII